MLVAWVCAPFVLVALCFGCGLLVQRVAGLRLGLGILLAAGLALIIVAGCFTTLADATAELTIPVVCVLATAGLAFGWRERPAADPGAIITGLLVYALFALPIVASGEATFAGYIRLDDTATWMALTDRVMTHGRDLGGLPPSSYEATLAFNLGAGYPVGAFIPLGTIHGLLGTDVAWLIQGYMATVAALLGMVLHGLARRLAGRGIAIAVAFLAAQSALLVGYYLWGGVKEVLAATLVAGAAGLAASTADQRFSARSLIPLAVVAAALLDSLAGGGAAWMAPLLAAGLGFAIGSVGWRVAAVRSLLFLALAAALAIPIIHAGLKPPTSASLTSETAQGNLIKPLEVWRLAGVWPAGDFRLDPQAPVLAAALVGLVIVAAALGIRAAYRARAWGALAYVLGALAAGLGIYAIGSPWVGGKALATAAPAVPMAAGIGVASLINGRQRATAAILGLALAGGVLWSNALAYRDVNLAPRDQLAELEHIGGLIAGQGPTLMTEYQPYGVRHFLRDAAPEGASELRRRPDTLANGRTLEKGETADTDRFLLSSITQYRTLVLRRSPVQSRPPSQYRLVWSGDYYQVWQRAPDAAGAVFERLGLGTATDPSGVPRCRSVRRLARDAGPGGRILAARRRPDVVAGLGRARRPSGWPMQDEGVVPLTPGTVTARVSVPRRADYGVWVMGSLRPQVDLVIDGREVGSVRGQLENAGEYVHLGDVPLDRGVHRVALTFHGSDLHPGSGGQPTPVGPLILSSQEAGDAPIDREPRARWRTLCGHRWDWIEAVRARR